MSYIAFDLDALNVVPSVARAAGMTDGDVAHGLLKLWAYCFREELDLVSSVHLAGFFNPTAAPALVAFGFVYQVEDGYRVRGAERYLRIKEAQREGGKLGRSRSSSKVGATSTPTSGSTSGSTPTPTSGSQQALTPSTEHRAPNIETTYVASVALVAAPTTDPDGWQGEEFFAWAQSRRIASELPPERPPHPRKLSTWWSQARMAAPTKALQEAYYRFGDDKYWGEQAPPWPFTGFVAQWDRWLPKGVSYAP